MDLQQCVSVIFLSVIHIPEHEGNGRGGGGGEGRSGGWVEGEGLKAESVRGTRADTATLQCFASRTVWHKLGRTFYVIGASAVMVVVVVVVVVTT